MIIKEKSVPNLHKKYGPSKLKDTSPKRHGPMQGGALNQEQYKPNNLKLGPFKVKK